MRALQFVWLAAWSIATCHSCARKACKPGDVILFASSHLRFSSWNATNACGRWGCSSSVSARLHCSAKQWREKNVLSLWNAPECYTVLRYTFSLHGQRKNWFMLSGVYAGMMFRKSKCRCYRYDIEIICPDDDDDDDDDDNNEDQTRRWLNWRFVDSDSGLTWRCLRAFSGLTKPSPFRTRTYPWALKRKIIFQTFSFGLDGQA